MHREGQGEGEEVVSSVEAHESCFDGSLVVKMRWTLVPPKGAAVGARILCNTTYTFLPSGGVHIDSSFFAPSTLPPLPRAGVDFALPGRFKQARWVGLGPHEAYDDRRFSVYMGTFESSVAALHTPYVYPQENGRRADPRWVYLYDPAAAPAPSSSSLPSSPSSSSKSGLGAETNTHTTTTTTTGLLILPCAVPTSYRDVTGWGWSASHYSTRQLEAATHQHHLTNNSTADSTTDRITDSTHTDSTHTDRAEKTVFVHLDSQSMGVGGYDSWSPNVDPSVLIETGEVVATPLLLLPLRGDQRPSDAYVEFVLGGFDLSRDEVFVEADN
jgi:hypothetical protein